MFVIDIVGVVVLDATEALIPVPALTLTDVTPELELVPAPIKFLTSAAVIPEPKLGVEPFDNIATYHNGLITQVI